MSLVDRIVGVLTPPLPNEFGEADPRYLLRSVSPDPWARLRSNFKEWRRYRKNVAAARQWRKKAVMRYPDHGYSLLGDRETIDGLGRAYRYEFERLKSEGLYNPSSRNILILAHPRLWRSAFRSVPEGFADMWRIGFWMTEFDTLPTNWGQYPFDIVHEIWTPSDFSARAFRKATSMPVTVVPHAVRIADGPAMPRARFGVAETAFLGLAIMDLSTCPDRKNPLGHIAAWRAAFDDDPNCVLLMKVRFGQSAQALRQELKHAIGNCRTIRLVEDQFSDAEIRAFQRMGDAYLSLHRAEGYGLNIHEMLELGKPVIATGYSGNMTFMRRYTHAHAVPYRIVKYREELPHFNGDSLSWADPDIDAAAKLLLGIRHAQKNNSTLEQSMDYRIAV